MKQTTISSGNCAGIIAARIVLGIGLALLIFVPVFGWVLGPLVMLFALFMGGRRQTVWRCKACRAIVARGFRSLAR